MKIEDYGLIGDLQTAALVGRNGSIDWLCLPRFDSASCFSALLGDEHHGRWLLAPANGVRATSRRYRPGTLIIETDFETDEGAVRLIDFMPRRGRGAPQLVRIVEGLEGRVPMRMDVALRPDYGAIVPLVDLAPGGMNVAAGPDAFRLSTPLELRAEDGHVTTEFDAIAGARERFVLSWHPSYEEATPPVEDAESALARTETAWREWSDRCTYDGDYHDEVLRSLITLKALTHEVTGAVIAAPTTSLPEEIGGVRNWDYRYSWLRDTALTLIALFAGGYTEEAAAYSDYIGRVATGDPSKVQIMYGVGGERRLNEFELDHLPGYEGSAPVRVGNAAAEQFQLDVYGELTMAVFMAGQLGMEMQNWDRWVRVADYVESIWREPDEGIWEVRGPRRHFVSSKVSAWIVFDRSVRMAERLQLEAPVERWTRTRDEIHKEVCEQGYDPERRTFTQYYGSKELDASVLSIALAGFLPHDDERVIGTVAAIERDLTRDGLVSRYSTDHTDDGLPGDEGQFLACSFWLVGGLALTGRLDDARALYERLLGLSNDLGLLSEEYDVVNKRQVGNFPQAFSHLALVNATRALTQAVREPGSPSFGA
jgi:GH15 family glucan-1,4-alpha-glucosidase